MANEQIKLKMIPDGPVMVESGSYEIVLTDGSTTSKDAPFALCRCGASKNKPFCDGSHKECGFKG